MCSSVLKLHPEKRNSWGPVGKDWSHPKPPSLPSASQRGPQPSSGLSARESACVLSMQASSQLEVGRPRGCPARASVTRLQQSLHSSMVAFCPLLLPSILGALPRCKRKGIRSYFVKGRCQGSRKTCRIGSFSSAVLGKQSVMGNSRLLSFPGLRSSHLCDEDSDSVSPRHLPPLEHETGSDVPFIHDISIKGIL